MSSLRELERFTRSDLECMWVGGGGVTPDHSILGGRFIVRHEQELSGPLFESIVQAVLQRTGSGRERLAGGDGTVLEAMSSRYALIKREALEAQRAQLREQVELKGEDCQEQVALARSSRPARRWPSARRPRRWWRTSPRRGGF